MRSDVFQTISQVEEEMRAAKAEAEATVRKMIARAEGEGEAIVGKAKYEAHKEVEKMLAEAESAGRRAASEIANSTENKRAVTRAGVEKRLDEAADYIVGRIVNG